MEILMEFMARGFVTMLSISMPCVLTAASVGLIVGILQAVTQVQEQTIAAAPKILSVFLVIMIGGYGFTSLLTNLTTEGFQMAFNVVPKNADFVLPSDYYKYTVPFKKEMEEHFDGTSSIRSKMGGSIQSKQGSRKEAKYISPPKETAGKTNIVEDLKINN